MARLLNVAGLTIGLFALILQFGLTIPDAMEAGRGLAGSIVFYFSFFTILTNILAVLVHGAALFGRQGFFTQAWVRAGIAIAITVVGTIYWLLLSALWEPEGLFLFCDIVLHYVAPAIYLAWWLSAGTDGSLGWRHIPLWLAYPLVYMIYVLARAQITGEVPYPFLDVALNGWPSVLVTSAAILLLFAFLGRLAILADRLTTEGSATRETGGGS